MIFSPLSKVISRADDGIKSPIKRSRLFKSSIYLSTGRVIKLKLANLEQNFFFFVLWLNFPVIVHDAQFYLLPTTSSTKKLHNHIYRRKWIQMSSLTIISQLFWQRSLLIETKVKNKNSATSPRRFIYCAIDC